MLLNLFAIPVTKGYVAPMIPMAAGRQRHYTLLCPAFSAPQQTWGGASMVTAIISVPILVPYSFSFPVAIQSTTFIPVVKIINADLTVTRYKLWSTGTEILPVANYAGEAIPPGAIIEIWSVLGSNPAMTASWNLELGSVLAPFSPNDFSSVPLTTGGICVIQATTLDQMFTSCF